MSDRPRIFEPAIRQAPVRNDPQPGDLRDGSIYVYDKQRSIVDAVNVALFAYRPLLVSGPPGSGKSSLAPSIAREFGWRYYSVVIGSRTQAADLLWTVDAVRRLADAQAQRMAERDEDYIEPGVLWWAFDPSSARRRGISDAHPQRAAPEPHEMGVPMPESAPAVVLIDEIDKADPDVPNDLLVPLGSYEFRASNGTMIRAEQKPFVVITTNRERDLPAAFKRRCIELSLPAPDVTRLVQIAEQHFGTAETEIYRTLAEATVHAANDTEKRRERPPSTAEFLDAVRVWRALQASGQDMAHVLETIKKLAIQKPEVDGDLR